MAASNDSQAQDSSEAPAELAVTSHFADAPRGQGDWVEPKFALFVLADVSNDVNSTIFSSYPWHVLMLIPPRTSTE
jgi:hypothetical protein